MAPADFAAGAGWLQATRCCEPGRPHRRAGPGHACRPTTSSRSCPHPGTCAALIPLAAYFDPAAFDRPIAGRLHRHALGRWRSSGDAGAQLVIDREHQRARGVPGPPPAVRRRRWRRRPRRACSLEAPEFHEGWGMYCEQMMLEAGFRGHARASHHRGHRCHLAGLSRIILDIRLHRGEIGVDEAIDFLVEHTRFERPVAKAEVYPLHPDPRLQPLLPAGQGATPAITRR